MDFRDSADEAAFRAAAAFWLDATLREAPPTMTGDLEERTARGRWWQEQLWTGGWAGLPWPPKYGGRGLLTVYEAIFGEECARRDAPVRLLARTDPATLPMPA